MNLALMFSAVDAGYTSLGQSFLTSYFLWVEQTQAFHCLWLQIPSESPSKPYLLLEFTLNAGYFPLSERLTCCCLAETKVF